MMDKLVVVTRRTRLADLVARFNTRAQARFYIEHAGGDFRDYEAEDDTYRHAVDRVLGELEVGLKTQVLERGLVPTYLFAPTDLVVTVGQDGLVANTAKYALGNTLIAVNPDPARFDGVLLPYQVDGVRRAAERVLAGKARVREVTLAEARLDDGQRLLGFNDLFLGAQSHVSARYRIRWGDQEEPQSSSGVLVSTGAGSTGWMSSVFNMAASIARLGGQPPTPYHGWQWEERRLMFVVREPFHSRTSRIALTAGWVEEGAALRVESLMPSGGVIFSDGVEADRLAFNAGASATLRAAPEKARLAWGESGEPDHA
ncbi:MAG: NAD+ kinase [Deltaproteobacteria bacterium]|nr:NAD+ kinase [Deltaproteobacteria bacterium]